jgi:hypothetical protein
MWPTLITLCIQTALIRTVRRRRYDYYIISTVYLRSFRENISDVPPTSVQPFNILCASSHFILHAYKLSQTASYPERDALCEDFFGRSGYAYVCGSGPYERYTGPCEICIRVIDKIRTNAFAVASTRST